MRLKVRTWSALFVAALAVVLIGGELPATAAGLAQPVIASPLPFAKTPNIVDGTDSSGVSYRVLDMADMGTRIVVVGGFAQVQDVTANGGTLYNRANIFSFDPGTGKVDPLFAPAVTGQIAAVEAGPNGTLFIGGTFSQVNGVPMRNVAELKLADGSLVTGWPSHTFNGAVNDLALAPDDSRLFVGGVFTAVDGISHGGLASLNATTGLLDPYMSLDTAGHHNYGSAANGGTAFAPVGVSKMDISPDGSQMVAIGNFKTMEGLPRDQVAKILLPSTSTNPLASASVDPNWQTNGYTPACAKNAFDSYIRGVRWSPDGQYFVIVATGAYFANTLCDSAARFNLSDTGSNVQPAWADLTGGDTLWNVEITGSAVYVGGHQRWLNNPMTADNAAAGAVPRPGVAALDPDSGIPLTWNPGRNPRGIGAQALLATATALYVGSDTDYIGNFSYKHNKLAAFPLAGGTTPLSRDTGSLPGNIYLAGKSSSNAVTVRSFNGSTAGTDGPGAAGSVQWSLARGGFMAGNILYYGYPDTPGTASSYKLYRQTFDGTTYGAVNAPPARGTQLPPNSNVDPHPSLDFPYKDPYWDGVATGSKKNGVPITYDGVFPSFYGTELSTVTGMFYANGRLYYAKTGSSNLMYRLFSVDSGIVGQTAFTVPNTGFTIPGATGFSNAGGMFLSGGFLYIVNRNTGDLRKIAFSSSGVLSGTATTVSGPTTDGKDWRAQALYIGPGSAPTNQPPTASFTSSCSGLTCTFNGSSSTDPNGDSLTYSWNFGDGSAQTAASSSPTVTYTYGSGGSYPVTLTVDDGKGGTNTSPPQTVTVAPVQQGTGVGYRASADAQLTKATNSISLTAPPGIQSTDGMVLVLVTGSGVNAPAPPAGFTQTANSPYVAMSGTSPAMTIQVFTRIADGSESNGTIAVPLSGNTYATLQLVVYSGTPSTGPVRSVTPTTDTNARNHVTPTATATAGDWVLQLWSDKSASARTWTPPGDVTVRSNLGMTAVAGSVAALLADSGAAVTGTTVGGETASTSANSSKSITATILIAGS